MDLNTEKKIYNLISQVGRPAEEKNKDGSYQGCLYPVQYLYKIKKYKNINPDEIEKNNMLALQELKKYFEEIPISKIEKGDIVTGTIGGVLHFGIYFEYNKFIHVLKTLQIGRLKILKNIRVFRVK